MQGTNHFHKKAWQQRYVDLLPDSGVDEPVTLTSVKLFLRIDSAAENAIIMMLISAARQLIEAQTGITLVSRDFKTFLPRFPGDPSKWWDGMIEGPETWINNYQNADAIIRRAPVTAVGAITAYGADGSSTVVDTGVYESSFADIKQPTRIRLKFGQVWPAIILKTIDGVEIDFTAGYGVEGLTCPLDLQLAIMVVTGELYAKRGDGDLQTSLATSSAWPTISRYVQPDLA